MSLEDLRGAGPVPESGDKELTLWTG